MPRSSYSPGWHIERTQTSGGVITGSGIPAGKNTAINSSLGFVGVQIWVPPRQGSALLPGKPLLDAMS